MKIAYFGSPIFSAALLEKLILDKSLGIEIALVVTQPDKPVGRKMVPTPSPVKVVAQKYGIPVYDNLKFEIRNSKSSSNDKFSKNLIIENLVLNKNLKFQISNLDLCMVYAYGFKQLIPLDLLKAPKMQFEIGEGKTSGFVNVHPSLLPQYRGSSPIAYPILLGENKTGITLFVMDEKMDHGPIISQEEMEITLTDVRPDMETKLTDLGFEMVKKFLISTDFNRFQPIQQNHPLASRAPYMTRDDGFIPLSVLKKALNNEPLTLQELPQIIQRFLSRHRAVPGHSVVPRHPGEGRDPVYNFQSKDVIPSLDSRLRGNDIFNNSSKIIYDFWRGIHPWPGLWTLIQPVQLLRLDKVLDDRTEAVGSKRLKIINIEYRVETGHAPSLQIKTVQLEGKSPTDFPTFQKAYQIFK